MKRFFFCGAAALAPAAVFAAEGAGKEGLITGSNLLDTFMRGGPMMWPILLCSVIALAMVFERAVTLRAGAVFPRDLLKRVEDSVAGDRIEEARNLCRKDKSPLASLMYSCLSRSDAPGFEMETALEEAGSRILYDLRRNSRPLGIIGDIAPLLGLMGTVMGMIKAFEVVARTGALGRAQLLAEGIGEALLTTAFGLAVGIPSIIFYQYFRGKADGLLRSMEDACIRVMDDLRNRRKQA
ncbi:MAG: MotA/TolQ/ExbB proton channel family protein [Kiritimatiellia bacterium]